jgi:hypothetical protein
MSKSGIATKKCENETGKINWGQSWKRTRDGCMKIWEGPCSGAKFCTSRLAWRLVHCTTMGAYRLHIRKYCSQFSCCIKKLDKHLPSFKNSHGVEVRLEQCTFMPLHFTMLNWLVIQLRKIVTHDQFHGIVMRKLWGGGGSAGRKRWGQG